MLKNLLSNAFKFTEEGGVRLDIVAAESGWSPRHTVLSQSPMVVAFRVSDTGPGIPVGQLPAVFDRYWQAAPGSSSGVGLGLFIVKGIVEAHGGKVWAESPAGEGASFFFTLPIAS